MKHREKLRCAKACEVIVEDLKKIIGLDPTDSLASVYLSEDENGRKVMTRRDLKIALNYILPPARQLFDNEYRELANYLDPDTKNTVYVEDYIKLFRKDEPKECECFTPVQICPAEIGCHIFPKTFCSEDIGTPCQAKDPRVRYDIVNKTAEIIASRNKPFGEDDLDLFRKCVVDTLKNLDHLSQEKAKVEIQEVLARYTMKTLQKDTVN